MAKNLNVLFASFLKNQLGSFSRPYTDHWGLHFIIEGEASLRIDQTAYSLQGSWIWAGYPGPLFVQTPTSEFPRGHYRAALSGNLLEQWLDDGLWPRKPLPIHDTAAMSEAWETFLRRLEGNTPLHTRRQAHALEGVLLEAWHQQDNSPQQAKWLTRACDWLRKHAHEKIHYPQLADSLNIPLPTLRRHFRQSMGMPMHRFVLEHRCDEAKQLLLETTLDMDIIAQQLGYDDVAYFSRQFKTITGLNPSTFRQQRYY